MRYEAEVDLRNENTSHALLVNLVGRNQRVLDVGCATGYLGEMLKRRGCRVSGVEEDEPAALQAREVLDEVIVGDVNTLDLVGHFGEKSFDAVVFGDVLEHLSDPLAVLRKVRPLLTDSGAVVASIPNVAHGSVRLALLAGRFDYRPLGLLDSTHLRFFTRGSVHELLRQAGLVPIDVRRTTAGVFDTEIRLRREDFDEGIVDAVEGDPDSTTYQFVVRAVPEEGADGTPGAPAALSSPGAERCRIGIWATIDPDDVRQALVMRLTRAELARRLPGSAIRSFSADAGPRPSRHDGGVPVEALGQWSPERARTLATDLDCVVIVGDLPEPGDAAVEGGRHPARFILEGPARDAEDDCPVIWSAVRLPEQPVVAPDPTLAHPAYRAVLDVGWAHARPNQPDDAAIAVPDPLLLVPRLLRPDALARRLEFLRIMGWFPPEGPAVVVELGGGLVPHTSAVARALDSAVAASGGSVVLVQIESHGGAVDQVADAVASAMAAPVYRLPGEVGADDLVAAIVGATAFATCSPSGAALGLASERVMAFVDLAGDVTMSQLAGITGNLDAVVTDPTELARLLDDERFRPAAGVVAKMQSRLDAHFDRLAGIADAAAAARPRTSDSSAQLPPAEYVAALGLAHRRIQERIEGERRAIAAHLDRLRCRHEAALGRSEAEIARLRSERVTLDAAVRQASERADREAELQSRADRAVADLEALQGVRVLRLLRPARAVYARLRGSRL